MTNWLRPGNHLFRGNAGIPIAAAAPAPTPTPSPSPTPTPTFSISKTDSTTQTRYAQIVTTPFASKWAGYQGESFFSDVLCTTDAQFDTAYANARTNAANNRWQRIRCTSGVQGMYMDDADFKPRNGGGLLIEPAAGSEDYVVGGFVIQSFSGVPRGVQIGRIGHGFTFANASAAGNGMLRCPYPTSSNSAIVKIQGNRWGLIYAGYAANSLALVNQAAFAIRFFYAEEVQIVDNVFNGFENGIDVYGCRLAEIARNDFQQPVSDIIGYSAFAGGGELKGRFTDDHSYVWVHDNTVRNMCDYYGFSPASTGPHSDVLQLRTTVAWGASTAFALNKWVAVNGNYYKCITAGTSAGSGGPTGTGADITDGTVHWQYMSSVATGPAAYCTLESNVVLHAASQFADQGATRYGMSLDLHINSDDTARTGLLALNNMQATRVLYGIQTGGTGLEFARAEFNTLGPSCEVALSGGLSYYFAPNIFGGGFTAGVYYARRNVCASLSGVSTPAVTEVENIVVSGMPGTVAPNRPTDRLAGTFTQNADGYWVLSYTDDGSVSPAQFIADMYARLKMADGSDYGAAF
jgi:hypothetical protein